MKQWVALIAVAASIVLGIQAFTAEGAPSTPHFALGTTLTPSYNSQSVPWTVTVTAMGSQPINSIDEQGAKLQFSTWINGKPLDALQTIALSVESESGFTDTLSATFTSTVPAVCATAGPCAEVENFSIEARAIVPAWTGVYASHWVNVTFSSASAYSSVQQPSLTPYAQFTFNFLGALTLMLAVDATAAIAILGPAPHLDILALGSWVAFAIELVALLSAASAGV